MTWDVVGLAQIRLAGRWRWIQAIRRCRWSWELVGLNAALQAHEQSFVKWAQTCSRQKGLCFRTWKKHPWKSSCVCIPRREKLWGYVLHWKTRTKLTTRPQNITQTCSVKIAWAFGTLQSHWTKQGYCKQIRHHLAQTAKVIWRDQRILHACHILWCIFQSIIEPLDVFTQIGTSTCDYLRLVLNPNQSCMHLRPLFFPLFLPDWMFRAKFWSQSVDSWGPRLGFISDATS